MVPGGSLLRALVEHESYLWGDSSIDGRFNISELAPGTVASLLSEREDGIQELGLELCERTQTNKTPGDYSVCGSADLPDHLPKVPLDADFWSPNEYKDWSEPVAKRVHRRIEDSRRTRMLDIGIDRIGELGIVECIGRIVRSEAAFQLRRAVTSLEDSRIIVLDLSEVSALEGGVSRHADISRTMGSRSSDSVQAVQSQEICARQAGTRSFDSSI